MSTTQAETADHEHRVDQMTTQQVVRERMDAALAYVGACVQRAHDERQAAVARRAGCGTPPTGSARESQLAQLVRRSAVAPLHVREHAEKLHQLNGCLLAIERSLIANPLWQEAAQIEDGPAPGLGIHIRSTLAAMDPHLADARDDVARCASQVVTTQAAVHQWESRPAWVRTAEDRLFQTGRRVREELSAATDALAAAQATLDQLYAQAEAQALRAHAAEERADRRRRDRAHFQREILEIPLREAIVEGTILHEALRSRDLKALRDAQSDDGLQLVGLHRELGFTVLALESSETRYVADWLSLPEPDKALIERTIAGDILRYERREDGTRALKIAEFAALTLEQPRLEGTVGATEHCNEQLIAFQLIDEAGATRWVRPTRGADLAQDLRGETSAAIASGNQIRIQNREVHVISRPLRASVER